MGSTFVVERIQTKAQSGTRLEPTGPTVGVDTFDVKHKLCLLLEYKHSDVDFENANWPTGCRDAFYIGEGRAAKKTFRVPNKIKGWTDPTDIITATLPTPATEPTDWVGECATGTSNPVIYLQEINNNILIVWDGLPAFGVPTGGEVAIVSTLRIKCYHHFALKNYKDGE